MRKGGARWKSDAMHRVWRGDSPLHLTLTNNSSFRTPMRNPQHIISASCGFYRRYFGRSEKGSGWGMWGFHFFASFHRSPPAPEGQRRQLNLRYPSNLVAFLLFVGVFL